eukprot:jgi/Psemu1/62875/estExt_Genemark1.C_110097
MDISHYHEGIEEVNYLVRAGKSTNEEDSEISSIDQVTIIHYNKAPPKELLLPIDTVEGILPERLIVDNTAVLSAQTQRYEYCLFDAFLILLYVSLISLSFVVVFVAFSCISRRCSAKTAKRPVHNHLLKVDDGDIDLTRESAVGWHGNYQNYPSQEMEHRRDKSFDLLDVESNSFQSHAGGFLNDSSFATPPSCEKDSILYFIDDGDEEGHFI